MGSKVNAQQAPKEITKIKLSQAEPLFNSQWSQILLHKTKKFWFR